MKVHIVSIAVDNKLGLFAVDRDGQIWFHNYLWDKSSWEKVESPERDPIDPEIPGPNDIVVDELDPGINEY